MPRTRRSVFPIVDPDPFASSPASVDSSWLDQPEYAPFSAHNFVANLRRMHDDYVSAPDKHVLASSMHPVDEASEQRVEALVREIRARLPVATSLIDHPSRKQLTISNSSGSSSAHRDDTSTASAGVADDLPLLEVEPAKIVEEGRLFCQIFEGKLPVYRNVATRANAQSRPSKRRRVDLPDAMTQVRVVREVAADPVARRASVLGFPAVKRLPGSQSAKPPLRQQFSDIPETSSAPSTPTPQRSPKKIQPVHTPSTLNISDARTMPTIPGPSRIPQSPNVYHARAASEAEVLATISGPIASQDIDLRVDPFLQHPFTSMGIPLDLSLSMVSIAAREFAASI